MEVRIAAIPSPLGTISNHSSKSDVRFSSRNETSTFAQTMRSAEMTVSVQYFPVCRMILVLYFSTRESREEGNDLTPLLPSYRGRAIVNVEGDADLE